MEIHLLSEQVSVSGQMTADDVQPLVDAGVQVLVCNRPDFEQADQPTFDSVAQQAQAANLTVVNLPFAGPVPEEIAIAFKELMASGQRIHAYCRTGNRCAHLWQLAQSL